MALNDKPHGVGRIGIWDISLRSDDPARQREIGPGAAELEELGYGALWLGGSPALTQAEPALAATSRIAVGTSILSIWDHTAADVSVQHAELTAKHGDRLFLGLGVSHAETQQDARAAGELRTRPYSAMRAYLDELDAAPRPVPAERRALAALGPKMLRLSRDRTLGALPYLVTTEHTEQARRELGPDALLAPELKVVLDDDIERARATARQYLGFYLALTNYRNSWLRLGFTEDELADGGSDRLLDSVYALGDAETVRAKVDSFFDAGADHVAIQVVNGDTSGTLPLPELRTLADALPLGG